MASYALYFLLLFYLCNGQQMTEYGPYNVDWIEYKPCDKVAAKMSRSVKFNTHMVKQNNSYRAFYNLTVLQNTELDGLVNVGYRIQNGHKILVLNQKLTVKPCQNYFLKSLMESLFNSTDCLIKMGKYFLELNLSQITKQLVGNKTFYGNYQIKTMAMSRKKYIACIFTSSSVTKKP